MEMVNSVSKCIKRTNADWSNLESNGVADNILSRLPVKYLLNVNDVSTSLRRLIHTQAFVKLHLSRSRENAKYIFFPFMPINRDIYSIDADAGLIETVTLPTDECLSSLSMICSYNGLIFLSNFPVTLNSYSSAEGLADLLVVICNPATRDSSFLPECSPSKEELGIGVAFGPDICECKVFRFFRSHSNSEIVLLEPADVLSWSFHPDTGPKTVVLSDCEIYSSITGVWRCIGRVPHLPMGAHHIFVSGKVYWFTSSKEKRHIPGSILSADMEEHFQVIGLPEPLTENSFLIEFEGCLSVVVVSRKDGPVVIWVLKCEKESVWEKKCSAAIPYRGMMKEPQSVAARGSEIFFITAHNYIILHTDDGSWDIVTFEEFEPNSHAVFSYTESLLPCGEHCWEVNNETVA